MRTQTFRVKRSNPDYKVAINQLIESRRLYNTLIAVSRESRSLFLKPGSDTHISKELGLLDWVEKPGVLSNFGTFERIRKTVEKEQGIVLPQKVAQHVAREVALAWKSYYALKKVNPKAKPPRYKQKFGLVQYTKQAVSMVKAPGRITPTGWSHGVQLPGYIDPILVQAARLIYKNGDIWLDIMHKTPYVATKSIGEYSAAIDLGVDNLATLIINKPGYRPKIVDGKHIKSVNQFANKVSAEWRTKLDIEAFNIWNKLDNKEEVMKGKIGSRKLEQFWGKRNRRINHYLHSASNAIVKELIAAGVGELIIGWNEGFKNSSNIGRKNNQSFVQIPHAKFRDMLIIKAERAGITTRIQEESYTSKASYLDRDAIPVHKTGVKNIVEFSGKRTKRGEYVSRRGIKIHADVNAAWNILQKSKPPTWGPRGIIVMPQKLVFSF